MSGNLVIVDIRYEQDVVLARQRARQIAALLNFTTQEQTTFATSVSELARNAFRYAGGGKVAFAVRAEAPPALVARVQDKGPGIPDLRAILEGRYQSSTGMGLGIIGSKRLSDEFDITSTPGAGTLVVIGKRLPKRAPHVTPQVLADLSAELAQRTPKTALEEVQEQNKELLQALDDLRARQAEVERLNAELAETNRGVVALYAELDDKAVALRHASEAKSRFLSDMTHELRTPLNAIVSLSGLLLDRVDGNLTTEQEKQVSLINKSARSLGEMVNDLLDLAKIEAGKTELHLSEFSIYDLLGALRGMFRPLVNDAEVRLHIHVHDGLSVMYSDERKLSQILRNLLSNAIKFTEVGDIRVSAEPCNEDAVTFSVTDTGIGIAPEYLDHIFEDFTQIDSGRQRRVSGTGLGLPLTRRLARLLGGDVTVRSELNAGSTFSVTIPLVLTVEPAGQTGDDGDDGHRSPALNAQGGRHA